jgi:hypothetical protein
MNPKPIPPEPTPPPPGDEAEERRRAAYIERNLWFAVAGMVLFALALIGT